MFTSDTVQLIGIIAVFLTTIVGWIFTYRTQRAILDKQNDSQKQLLYLQEKLAFDREQRQSLIADKLTRLKDFENWLEKGRRIYLEAVTLLRLDSATRLSESRSESIRKLIDQLKEFRASSPRFLYLARLYDPSADTATRWAWGSSTMPDDLPQIIDAFENEVQGQGFEAIQGKEGRLFPYVDGQFHGLHEAAIRAIERLKGRIATTG